MIRPIGAVLLELFLLAMLPLNAENRGTLSGTTLDTNGKPVLGALVRLYRTSEADPLLQTTSSGEGAFQFDGLSPLIYRLVVEKGGFARVVMPSVKVSPVAETRLPPIRLAPAAPR